MPAMLALSTALLYGFWSFGTGVFARQMSHYTVILVSGSAAALVYVSTGLFTGTLLIDAADLSPGLLGGLLNLGGTILLLAAYARGKLGVAAGIEPVSVLIPLAYSIAIGEALTRATIFGVVVILVGLALFTVPSGRGGAGGAGSLATIGLCAGAAVLYGTAVVVLDIVSRVSVNGTMAVSMIPEIAIALTVVLATRSVAEIRGRSLVGVSGAGIALGLGSIAFYTAANEGDIGTVSVLASLSPILTTLLALVFLGERMLKVEIAGLMVVLVGSALILL